MVNNVAPQNVSAGPDQTADEGQTVSFAGSFTDPGTADTHTLAWAVLDASGTQVATGSGSAFSFTPSDNGAFTVVFTATDDDGGATSAIAKLTVNNVAPQNVSAGADQTANEGQAVSFSGTYTDPGS